MRLPALKCCEREARHSSNTIRHAAVERLTLVWKGDGPEAQDGRSSGRVLDRPGLSSPGDIAGEVLLRSRSPCAWDAPAQSECSVYRFVESSRLDVLVSIDAVPLVQEKQR